MSINIILSSHGLYAAEALKTAEMIIGNPQDDVHVISVREGRSYDECLAELQGTYEKLPNKENGTLILVDIFGGTPANISSYLALTQENIQVYSGFNIPILLELLLGRPKNLVAAQQMIETTYQQALVDITKKLKEGNENGDTMDSY